MINRTSTVSPVKVVVPPKPIVKEHVNERPTTQRVSGRHALSTPSILDALRDEPVKERKDVVSESNENQYVKTGNANSFTQQELLDAWKLFAGGIDSPHLRSALGAREPNLTDGWQIIYELDNELQLNQLILEVKPKLIGYLRRHFKNESIDIKFNVSEDTVIHSHIPYTDAERWALLAEKYPGLAQLKSKFGLDFEHF